MTITEIRDETGDITENIKNTYKFDTFDGAINAADSLRESNHDYVVSVSVVSGETEYVKTEVLSLSSIFDSKEEALTYIASLEDNGYVVTVDIKEVNEHSALDGVYETIEEAEEALAEFLREYPETELSNIEEVRDEAGDVTESIENTYKFDNIEEAEETAESLREEEQYYVVTVDVVEENPEHIGTVNKTISVGFESREEALAYIASLEKIGYNVDANIKEVNELGSLDKVYETFEEAEEALAEFLREYPETEESNIEEIRDEAGDVTEKVENTYKFDTFDGAVNAAESLIINNHDYIVEVSVVAGDPELVETKTLTLNMVFNSRDDALDYISNLETDGYTVYANIDEVIEISTLDQKFETREEAEEALVEFRAQCKELISSNIEEIRDSYEDTTVVTEGTFEYETKEEALEAAESLNSNTNDYEVVTSVREGNKTLVTGPTSVESEQFDSEAEAQAYIDNLASQGYDVSNLKIELVPFEESIWGEEDNVVVNPGTGSSSSFTYGHFDVTLLTKFTKIDSNGNKSIVTGTVTVGTVKINNKNVAMEGPTVDRNTGLTEYTSKERNRLNVTNNSLVEVIGTVNFEGKSLPFAIKGYLTESQNVCGGKLGRDKGFDLEFESITIINNKVIVDSNVVNKYKVVGTITKTEVKTIYYVDTTTITYGYDYNVSAEGIKLVGYSVNGSASMDLYKNIYLLDMRKTTLDYDYSVSADGIKFIEYLLTGNASMDIYKDVYTLDISKTTLDYDYNVNADGIKLVGHSVDGFASKDIYKDIYLLDINKTTLDYDYEVSGSGIKTYYDIRTKYVRLANANYIIEYMELGKGGDVEVLPPQTGVNENILLFDVIGTLVMTLFLFVKKFI